MGIPLFYEEINTPVLWVCQQSQSVSHFKFNSITKSGPSRTEVCQGSYSLLQISVNNQAPIPKLEFSRCVLANLEGGTRVFMWFPSQLIDQYPVSLVTQNLKQNKNKLIKSFRNFWIVLSLNVSKSKDSENHHMNVFHKNKPRKKKKKKSTLSFLWVFPVGWEKSVVWVCVCVCACTCLGKAVGPDVSGLWPPDYVQYHVFIQLLF